MNFVIASDANYFRHYAALFASVLNCSPGIEAKIYVVGDCSCLEYQLFRDWLLSMPGIHEVNPLVIDESIFKNLHVGDYHLSVVAYYRLLVPSLLRGVVSRFIYLDGDMIACDDLQRIYDMELNDAIIAAVAEPIYYNESALSLKYGEELTFNSGLLLVDVDRFCENQIGERAIEFALPRKLRYHDQDALNEILKGHWIQIPPRWNLQLFSGIVTSNFPQYTEVVAQTAFSDPGLIHFVGPRKPWMPFCNHPYRKLYWKYNAMTPWAKSGMEWRRFFHWLKGKIKRSLSFL